MIFLVLASLVIGIAVIIGSAYLFYRWEWKSLLVIAGVLAFFVALSGRVADLPSALVPFMLGCIGGLTFKYKKSFQFYILITSFLAALIFVGLFYYMVLYLKFDLTTHLSKELSPLMDQLFTTEESKTKAFAELARNQDLIVFRFPFAAFLYSIGLSGLSYVFLRLFFVGILGKEPVEGLEQFQLNEYVIFLLIGGWAIFLIFDFLIDNSDYLAINSVGFNIGAIIATLYFVQALGIIKFKMIKKGIPTYLLPLLGLLLVSFDAISIFFIVMLIGLGTLDLWADFRKLKTKEDQSQIPE